MTTAVLLFLFRLATVLAGPGDPQEVQDLVQRMQDNYAARIGEGASHAGALDEVSERIRHGRVIVGRDDSAVRETAIAEFRASFKSPFYRDGATVSALHEALRNPPPSYADRVRMYQTTINGESDPGRVLWAIDRWLEDLAGQPGSAKDLFLDFETRIAPNLRKLSVSDGRGGLKAMRSRFELYPELLRQRTGPLRGPSDGRARDWVRALTERLRDMDPDRLNEAKDLLRWMGSREFHQGEFELEARRAVSQIEPQQANAAQVRAAERAKLMAAMPTVEEMKQREIRRQVSRMMEFYDEEIRAGRTLEAAIAEVKQRMLGEGVAIVPGGIRPEEIDRAFREAIRQGPSGCPARIAGRAAS